MAAFIPYILSIFSTPPKGITGHLKFLEAEKKSLLKIFETLKSAPDARSAFNVDYDPLDDDTDEPLGYQAIAERIDTFRLRNTIIHFSGHANMVNLSLQKEDIRATTFIKCLSQCEGLKVVVLNACSTQGFVRTILETTEVKAVIATTNPVGDETAMRFAENFYKKLAQREPLAAAFTYAVSRAIPNEFENDKYLLKVMVDAKNKLAGANQLLDDKGAQATRGIKKNISNILDKDDEPATWGLYTKSDQILDWRLFEPLTSAEVQKDVLAAEKKKLVTEKLGYKAELVEPEADLIYFGNLFKNNPTDITAKNKIEKAETLLISLNEKIKNTESRITQIEQDMKLLSNESRDDIILSKYRSNMKMLNYDLQKMHVEFDTKPGFNKIFRGYIIHGTANCCLDHLSKKISEWLGLSNIEKVFFDFTANSIDDFWAVLKSTKMQDLPDSKKETIVKNLYQQFVDETGKTQKDIIFLFRNITGKSGKDNHAVRILQFWKELADQWAINKTPEKIRHHIYAFIIDNNCELINAGIFKTNKEDDYKTLIETNDVASQSISLLPAVKPLREKEIANWEIACKLETDERYEEEEISGILEKTNGLFRPSLREISANKLILEGKKTLILSYIEQEIETAKL